MACIQLKMIKAVGVWGKGRGKEGRERGEERNREIKRDREMRADFLLGLCVSQLGNRVEIERKDFLKLVLTNSNMLGRVFSVAGLTSWSSSLE